MKEWKVHPEAEKQLLDMISVIRGSGKKVGTFMEDLLSGFSIRPLDILDHIMIREDDIPAGMEDMGFEHDGDIIHHPETYLPPLIIGEMNGLAIKVEDMDAFVLANNIKGEVKGERNSRLRKVKVARDEDRSLYAIDRRGYKGFEIDDESDIDDYEELLGRLVTRDRTEGEEAFRDLREMMDEYSPTLDTGRVADAFFRSERRYWEGRNSIGSKIMEKQNEIGIGWGNHDHHTFRCSRKNFHETIGVLRSLGMLSREGFYAGDQAGWGAQVLEQPDCNITVFCDVDLLPEEKNLDLSSMKLEGTGKLGTVGLWVGLHGESMLTAGLHHLAIRIDFDKARRSGPYMAPFSEFPYLRQCFSEGERWKVIKNRARNLVNGNLITDDQFKRFVDNGALGSHLELIERNQGFKGFNQTAVSDIIKRTDPRN